MSSATRNGKPMPWFPLYVTDFDSDTAHMSAEEVGAYVRLLNFAWLNRGIPDDVVRLAGISRVPLGRFKKTVWPTLKAHWRPRGEALVNKRQEKVRADARATHKRRVESGRRGGLAKAARP